MTDTEREKMLDKIRKLLALSTSPNENEAAAAAEKAQALLAEYNLTMADLDDKGEDYRIVPGAITPPYPAWKILGGAVARLYFCKHFFVSTGSSTSKKTVHTFVGEQHNIDVAKLMFDYLVGAVERMAREGANKLPTKERSPYRVSFRTMAVHTLCIRIRERIEASRRGEVKSSTGTALVLASLYDTTEQKVGDFLNSKLKLKTKAVARNVLHARGAVEGERAGKEIGLDTQVAGHAKHRALK